MFMRNFIASFGVAVVFTVCFIALLLVPTLGIFLALKLAGTLVWPWGLVLMPLWLLLVGGFLTVMAFAFNVLNE